MKLSFKTDLMQIAGGVSPTLLSRTSLTWQVILNQVPEIAVVIYDPGGKKNTSLSLTGASSIVRRVLRWPRPRCARFVAAMSPT